MSVVATYTKDPDANLDYTLDWTTWLNGDTISSVTFTVPSGLTKTDQSNTTTHSTVWLSSGSTGRKYTVTHHITTAAGRIDDRSIAISVAQR